MRSMQTKMLTEIENMVADRQKWIIPDIEAVAAYTYPNVGAVLVQVSFDVPLRVGFQFNGTYCTIQFTGPTVDASAFADTPPLWRKEVLTSNDGEQSVAPGKSKLAFYHLDYTDGVRLRAMWDMLAALLDTIGSEVTS